MPSAPQKPKYGFSLQHDAALSLCQAQFGTCPFGCAKDGAPNCNYNSVNLVVCEPGKRVAERFVDINTPKEEQLWLSRRTGHAG